MLVFFRIGGRGLNVWFMIVVFFVDFVFYGLVLFVGLVVGSYLNVFVM